MSALKAGAASSSARLMGSSWDRSPNSCADGFVAAGLSRFASGGVSRRIMWHPIGRLHLRTPCRSRLLARPRAAERRPVLVLALELDPELAGRGGDRS